MILEKRFPVSVCRTPKKQSKTSQGVTKTKSFIFQLLFIIFRWLFGVNGWSGHSRGKCRAASSLLDYMRQRINRTRPKDIQNQGKEGATQLKAKGGPGTCSKRLPSKIMLVVCEWVDTIQTI